MKIRKVGVVGCGLMGSGITQVCAQKGYPTIVTELNQELLDKGVSRIKDFLSKGVERGKVTKAEMDSTLGNITPTLRIEDFRDCDLVIEAIVEKLEAKQELFRKLDSVCKPTTILASNTSSISLTYIGSVTKRQDKVVGLHFFNPVPVMKLIEIVRTFLTSEETYSIVKSFSESLGKVTVTAKDTPGFIVNRLLIPYLLDAVRLIENGVATKEDIDTAMKLGCNHPMGPIELLDFIGLDTTLFIANFLYEEYGDPNYMPPVLLKRMVTAGHLGKKTGKGFYDYTGSK